MRNTASFRPKKVTGSIEQSNIKIRCNDDDSECQVAVRELGVLSKEEFAAQLSIKGENFQFVIDLDSVDLDRLEAGIHAAQNHLMEQNV